MVFFWILVGPKKLRSATDMKITVWKCEEDGKLFEFEADYKKHMAKLARARAEQKKFEENHRIEKQWWDDNFFNTVRSPAQLVPALNQHAQIIISPAIENYWGKKVKVIEIPTFHYLEFDFNFKENTSNTHDCPVGGERNFGWKEDKPRGYPGFSGRIKYGVYWEKRNEGVYPCDGDMFEPARIHSGGGGGGSMTKLPDGRYIQTFSYEYRLFLDDYPGIKKSMEQAEIWCALKGSKHSLIDIINIINTEFPAESYQPIVGE